MMLDVVAELGNNWAAILPMPNTKPAITMGQQALGYAQNIGLAGFSGLVIPTIKLARDTDPGTILDAAYLGVRAAKFYPRGLTTNAEDGIGRESFMGMDCVYQAMETCGMHLLMHGEMPGETNLNREIAFLVELERIAKKFPRLRITLEHITTRQAVAKVDELYRRRGNVTATITAHHLRVTLDTLLDGGLHMHDAYCKPIPKEPLDREALVEAVMSGNAAFRFGSDSAPHLQGDKEKDCGCAGVYTSPIAIPLMVDLFERHQRLARWKGFMFEHANQWFNLGLEPELITLERRPLTVPNLYHGVVPFMAGHTLDCYQVVQ